MKKKKGLTILDITLWGGLLFGGFTLAIMLWNAYGPKGAADGIYTSVGPIINFVPEVTKPHLGPDVKALTWLHGSVFAAVINFMVGAAITLFLAVGLRSLTKKK